MDPSVVILCTSLWLVANSFILQTKNIRSTVLFKFIPFVLGCANGIIGIQMLGWV